MDYDDDRIYYTRQNLFPKAQGREGENAEETAASSDVIDNEKPDVDVARRHFREFLKNYRNNVRYLYRERLLRMHQRQGNCIDVDLSHVAEYDTHLLDLVLRQPIAAVPAFEAAAVDALRMLLQENLESQLIVDDAQRLDDVDIVSRSGIQILFKGNLAATTLRAIQSHHINTLIRCPGIVISSTRLRPKATSLTVRCTRCNDKQSIPSTSGPFGGFVIPKTCKGTSEDKKCGDLSYVVIPDESDIVDQQTLKLQEAPEAVPTGEMPRSILMAVDRALCDRASPGTRVSVLAIPSLFQAASTGSGGASNSSKSVKTVYLRVVGMDRDSGSGGRVTFTPREEEAFRLLARRADIYDILYRSIAPSISGAYTIDIKKALACQLFSGSRKKLPDGMKLRGDINILLLGDPSMAKSQFLKYVTRIAPVGIYTSGKGSSAAGLTASVVKDQRGEFFLEGGALVLGDGGICAIDEFDKMRAIDRVAIHEAMEQQTISIAKAGITTVLNSRTSVLAAANPVFGRYDDLKSNSENIDLMSTILSRFDLIFLVRDIRDEERDKMICHHVMGVHMSNSNTSGGNRSDSLQMLSALDENNFSATTTEMVDTSPEHIAENAMRLAISGAGELDVPTMKKYIQYCKAKCSPRLTEEASHLLSSSYVSIRDDVRRRSMPFVAGQDSRDRQGDYQPAIPITVRQLEALVRISESLAKMRLQDDVQIGDVTEALRLFKVSTMAANAADRSRHSDETNRSFSDDNHQTTIVAALPSLDEMQRTESFLRSRLGIGIVVNKQRILEEAVNQGYDAMVVARALSVMVTRDEIQERNKGRLIKRIR